MVAGGIAAKTSAGEVVVESSGVQIGGDIRRRWLTVQHWGLRRAERRRVDMRRLLSTMFKVLLSLCVLDRREQR